MKADVQRRSGGLAATLGIALAVQLSAPIVSARAADGAIRIDKPFTRPTLGGASIAVGYLTVTNKAPIADRLENVTSDISATAEIHESKMENGTMEMDELPKGIEIPPGATVAFKPGAYHIMFVGIKHPVKAGDTIHATLTFERAGQIAVDFPAADSPGAMAPSSDMGGMGGMKMQ